MRRIICVIMVVFVMLTLSPSAYSKDNPLKKLGRGISNVCTSPLEIFKGISDANNENGFFSALSYGVFNGLFRMARRALVGTYEVVSFPVPIPKDYEPIIEDPEFFGE